MYQAANEAQAPLCECMGEDERGRCMCEGMGVWRQVLVYTIEPLRAELARPSPTPSFLTPLCCFSSPPFLLLLLLLLHTRSAAPTVGGHC